MSPQKREKRLNWYTLIEHVAMIDCVTSCVPEMLFAMSINAQLSYEYHTVVASRHARRLRVPLNLLMALYNDFTSMEIYLR